MAGRYAVILISFLTLTAFGEEEKPCKPKGQVEKLIDVAEDMQKMIQSGTTVGSEYEFKKMELLRNRNPNPDFDPNLH